MKKQTKQLIVLVIVCILLVVAFFVLKNINQKEAENLYSYLSTKFARFMLLMAVSSINLSKDKFRFVPLQDFSRPWTDQDLYEKYNLSEDEIAYIEKLIKPI